MAVSARHLHAASLAILVGGRDEARRGVADFLSQKPEVTGVRVWAQQLGLLE